MDEDGRDEAADRPAPMSKQRLPVDLHKVRIEVQNDTAGPQEGHFPSQYMHLMGEIKKKKRFNDRERDDEPSAEGAPSGMVDPS